MMHARAAMNKQGGVRFGLRHIREQPYGLTPSLLTSQMFSIDIHSKRLWMSGIKTMMQPTLRSIEVLCKS
jgi:hypothetical protein